MTIATAFMVLLCPGLAAAQVDTSTSANTSTLAAPAAAITLPSVLAPPPAVSRPALPPVAAPLTPPIAIKVAGPNVVSVKKDEGGYQLLIDGRPTMVYGMNWGYMPIGENYSYDFWGQPDDVIIDALDNEMTLMRDMKVNAIRQYLGIPPRWIKHIYEKYGIYTILNHPVARYGMTIDGTWVNPVDYSNPRLRELVTAEVTKLVTEYKDTPGLLMWMLGNENNYGLYWSSSEIEDLPEAQQGDARAKFLYSLMGELTDAIHALDSNHPVSLANGDVGFIELIKTEAPNIDIMGSNVYRGETSRDIFQKVEDELGVPFMYTEFGSDAYNAKTDQEDDVAQAFYLQALWQEIYEQSYGKGRVQNAIGGLIFQWSDGWWKYQQTINLDVHDKTASWSNEAYQSDWVKGKNNMNEEWFGICAKGQNDERGIYEVYPRSAYYLLQEAFKLDPYAPDTTLQRIRDHFGQLRPKSFASNYAASKLGSQMKVLERVRAVNLRLDIDTYTTGGKRLNEPARVGRRFDHTESIYLGVEAQPFSRVKAKVVVNALGNVAVNPIDEIFFENRGFRQQVRDVDGTPFILDGIQRFKLYQASLEWDSDYFKLEGFHRVGHYHWGYEGDFFGIYPEANYQHAVDMFNADTPNGFMFTGKAALDGLKIAFGPQLYWGANPSIIGKYYRKIGQLKFALVHQEDIAQQAPALTSSVIPQPQTRRTSLYVGYTLGKFTFDLGGIMAGTQRINRSFQTVREAPEPTYLESGYYVLDDTVRFIDTLGARAKVTLDLAPFFWYVQGGYRGLVSDAGGDPTLTITGWSLKESGQGNHWAVSSGAAIYLGNFVLAPNMLLQKPLEGPLPAIDDFFDTATGTYYPSVSLRNQLRDPFWVRSNRETYAFELLLAFDPTPDTFMWAWDNVQRENAVFSAALDFVYRVQPTSQDAAVAVAQEGFTFAFGEAAPAQNVWDLSLRTIVNFDRTIRFVNWIYAGEGQANGDDDRLVMRYGTYGRLTWGNLSANYHVKFGDWGPFDYYRDFNLTFPLQTMLDVSYNYSTPKWFAPTYTRFGVRGQYRTLDENSGRFEADPDDPGRNGREWEVKSYVQISL